MWAKRRLAGVVSRPNRLVGYMLAGNLSDEVTIADVCNCGNALLRARGRS